MVCLVTERESKQGLFLFVRVKNNLSNERIGSSGGRAADLFCGPWVRVPFYSLFYFYNKEDLYYETALPMEMQNCYCTNIY